MSATCVRGPRRPLSAAVLAAAVALSAVGFVPSRGPASATPSSELVSVIVRQTPGALKAPERAVEHLGGDVGRHIDIISGFVAEVPANALARLSEGAGIHSVTPDRPVELLSEIDGFDADKDLGSMYWVAQEVTGAGEMWGDGVTGKGVGVALIDSGVAPVDGLTAPGKVVQGADLSFGSQSDDLRYLDTFGHGTHMAGIIAGRDDALPATVQKGDSDHFIGMAPDARIINVKVADSFGATDVSQIIAAIDWVVEHRNDPGLNIRVLNLSFGTDGVQDYRIDPLAYAAEVAWRKGIVVVAAAGNGGYESAKLNNPAYDPFVLSVGGADGLGTYGIHDDTIPAWSSTGDGSRNPDLVAPGKSVVSLRVPGSEIDLGNPGGRVNDRFFRGSGTSQAAAVVSGAAALIMQQRPGITPNQVKKLLTSTASRLPAADPVVQGAGMLNLKEARQTATPSVAASAQAFLPSTGVGSLEAARGSSHLVDAEVELRGELDIFGATWTGNRWSEDAWNEVSWSGGLWNGNRWSGDSWLGNRWSASVWSGNRWSGNRWSDASWSGNRWSGGTWSGNRWSSAGWGR